MSSEKKILKALTNIKEAEQKKVVMTSDKYQELGDQLDSDTVVKIVDENGDNDYNDGEDYERIGREIEYGINPEIDPRDLQGEDDGAEAQVNVPKLQHDVQKFMDKLNLGQFRNLIAKIDKPIEKAELIAAFAERVGVPRARLQMVLKSLRATSENVNPRMKKSDLVEQVLKNK